MKYIANVGINYQVARGREVRVEPGEDVPAEVVARSPWLVEQGLVTNADDAEDGADGE